MGVVGRTLRTKTVQGPARVFRRWKSRSHIAMLTCVQLRRPSLGKRAADCHAGRRQKAGLSSGILWHVCDNAARRMRRREFMCRNLSGHGADAAFQERAVEEGRTAIDVLKVSR